MTASLVHLIFNIMVKRGIVVPEYEEINKDQEPDVEPEETITPPPAPVEETKPSE